jgi:hypothetical protein
MDNPDPNEKTPAETSARIARTFFEAGPDEASRGSAVRRHEQTIGDHYDWRPHTSFQNGGRPEYGSINAKGSGNCPNCAGSPSPGCNPPFIDGNGHTARLVMNLLLMRRGYPPTLILRANHRQYYSVLAQADSGKTDALVNFVGRAVESSLNLYLDACAPKAKPPGPEDEWIPSDQKIPLRLAGFGFKKDLAASLKMVWSHCRLVN